MIQVLLLITTLTISSFGCGSNKSSQRDARREQIRSQSEAKRKELSEVVGKYYGFLSSNDKRGPAVTLELLTKDNPQEEEGEVDPIMVPTLSGFLRINYKVDDSSQIEQINFSLKSANFDRKEERLDLVAAHPKYSDVFLSLDTTTNSTKISGTWSAPDSSLNGEIIFFSEDSPEGQTTLVEFSSLSLAGSYEGHATWEKKKEYQPLQLAIVSSFDSNSNLVLSASIKLFFGEQYSSEYLTYEFDEVNFNPLNNRLILRKNGTEFSFAGAIESGTVSGDWSAVSVGAIGQIKACKVKVLAPPDNYSKIRGIGGMYRGEIVDLHPQSNLPPRAQISFIASRDVTRPNGVLISGNIRYYLGEFDSEEYIEREFADIKYNFYTREIIAITTGETPITLIGKHMGEIVKGQLSHDALGIVANMEVKQSEN